MSQYDRDQIWISSKSYQLFDIVLINVGDAVIH